MTADSAFPEWPRPSKSNARRDTWIPSDEPHAPSQCACYVREFVPTDNVECGSLYALGAYHGPLCILTHPISCIHFCSFVSTLYSLSYISKQGFPGGKAPGHPERGAPERGRGGGQWWEVLRLLKTVIHSSARVFISSVLCV